jgi:hypothetical protein
MAGFSPEVEYHLPCCRLASEGNSPSYTDPMLATTTVYFATEYASISRGGEKVKREDFIGSSSSSRPCALRENPLQRKTVLSGAAERSGFASEDDF